MKLKIKLFFSITLTWCTLSVHAQVDSTKIHFQQAFYELNAMLKGEQALNFERAVFVTENAYHANAYSYSDFEEVLNFHTAIIKKIIAAHPQQDVSAYQSKALDIPTETIEQTQEKYRQALANWAIYTYLTDTIQLRSEGVDFASLPYQYSNEDPFGTTDWRNSQVIHLLQAQKGNCYALAALFKIFSERLNSDARMVTAPQHIYIEHRDPKGDWYNIELATRSFPASGSIQALTFTTREGLMNNIALRSLDLKQSVALCLVYLAKGYEHTYHSKADDFILACAESALQHDGTNLNALLLQAQVYEQRVMSGALEATAYEKSLTKLHTLGYRQMPDDIRNIIMATIQGAAPVATTDKTPNPFTTIGAQARYVTLSHGLFEEVHPNEKWVRYGQTIFDVEKGQILKFLEEDNSSYQTDPVVFALSVDPLTKSYPMLTPYQFASNMPIVAIDLDGLEGLIPESSWSGHNKKIPPAVAGFVNSAWEVVLTFKDIIVFYVKCQLDPKHYDLVIGQVKQQLALIMNNPEVRDALIDEALKNAVNATGELLGLEGEDQQQYRMGQLTFEGLTAFMGVEEIRGLFKTGNWSKGALARISKLESIVAKTALDPDRVPFKAFAQMSESEIEAFNHAVSRHGNQFGLKWGKKNTLPSLVDKFNEIASKIRKEGTFMGVQKKQYGRKGNGEPSKIVDTNVYEKVIDGKTYYYWETTDGNFISAGLKTKE